jgi:nucleoside-diphosphate-sugar epimerase
MRSKFKTLLIIGGSGFFAKSIIDNIYYYSFFKKIKNIILLSRGVNKIKIDRTVNNKIKIRTIRADISKLKKIPFADYIIYCAIDHNYYQDHKAVCNYYKLAKKYHLKSKILYTSSGAVYGVQPTYIKKINEDYLINNKRVNFKDIKKNNYSITKLKNEKIFKKLSQLKIKVSIARCFAFVGKHLPRDSNYVVGNFIKNILNKEKIEIKSDYFVIRSYMHEYDLVNWLLKIINNSNINCPIYNVGSDQSVDIRNLGLYLSNRYKLDIKLKKIKSNFKDKYLPSILKAKKVLKLKLKYNNFNAINEVIDRVKNN